jgi:hypothetical protein
VSPPLARCGAGASRARCAAGAPRRTRGRRIVQIVLRSAVSSARIGK